MSNLKVIRTNKTLDFESFNFPAGEVGLKINAKSTSFIAKTGFFAPIEYQTLIARIKSSNDIMELLMLTDALKRIDNTPIRLFLPYIPYQQQDRVCVEGESFSLKVFGDLINTQNYQKVTVLDPHSTVSGAVFNNLKVFSQFDIINKWTEIIPILMGTKLVSPDAGANKKTSEIAGFLGHSEFIRADKLRDLSNGKIKETIVYCDDLRGQNVCIVDDICVGGLTFTELAKTLKAKNCGKILLFVTHGIFSKGYKHLLENGIDKIYTTDSYFTGQTNSPFVVDDNIQVLSIEERFLNV